MKWLALTLTMVAVFMLGFALGVKYEEPRPIVQIPDHDVVEDMLETEPAPYVQTPVADLSRWVPVRA